MPCYANRETGIIENILSKTKDDQEAAKMIMLEYSDQHAGTQGEHGLKIRLLNAFVTKTYGRNGNGGRVVVKDAEVPGHNLMIQVFSFPGRYITPYPTRPTLYGHPCQKMTEQSSLH
jgi:hypothetical protein